METNIKDTEGYRTSFDMACVIALRELRQTLEKDKEENLKDLQYIFLRSLGVILNTTESPGKKIQAIENLKSSFEEARSAITSSYK